MANLPVSLFVNPPSVGASTSGANPSFGVPNTFSVEQLILLLQYDESRERALTILSKNRGIRDDLASLLWNSSGTIFVLLQEIIAIYPYLSSTDLTVGAANRVCNTLALFQCIASHPDTSLQFVKANIPYYLYPFLGTVYNGKPFEYLRLTSLGVIGALVKVEDTEVIYFLLESGIFPLCLRCMEVGGELSKTVATFILQKILMREEGLKYCCNIAERFFAVGRVLERMVEKQPSQRLLKHIIGCYLRLSQSPRACDGLRCCLPVSLSDSTCISLFREDPIAQGWLLQLFHNISTGHWSRAGPFGRLVTG